MRCERKQGIVDSSNVRAELQALVNFTSHWMDKKPGFIHFNAENGNFQWLPVPGSVLSQIDVVVKFQQKQ